MACGSSLRSKIFGCLFVVAVGLAVSPATAAEAFKSGVASFALWSDPVFRSEASGGAAVVAAIYGHGGPVVVRANSARTLAASPTGIASALVAAQRGLDPERDVLFVILTSHGAPEGIADKGGGREGLIPPEAVAELLAKSPMHHKVLIVSACFAGSFTTLADADTLVITAADSTHTSFGCVPEARWTYFGDAFFNKALRRDGSIRRAFAEARLLIAAREAAQGFTPSNPQIAGGDNVLAILDGAQ